MPPAGSGDPKRHARTQYHPRSSIGSPRWDSSQSSTPARPSGPTMRLPRRKSPWTTVRRGEAGRCSSSQRRPSSIAGRGAPSASTSERISSSWSPPRSGGAASSGIPWIAARAAAAWSVSTSRATAHSSSRSSLRAMVSPSRWSITMEAPPSSAPSSSATRVGTGTPWAAAARSSTASPCIPGPLPIVPGRSRWRIRRCGSPPPAGTSAKPKVSREAPPESRRRSTTCPERPTPSSTRSRPAASSVSRSPMCTSAQQYFRTVGYGFTAPPPLGWISKWRWGVPAALPVSPT